MQVLDFFASFILFLEVTKVTFNLLCSLFSALFDFSGLLLHFSLLLELDFCKSLLWRKLVITLNSRSHCLFHHVPLGLNLLNLVNVCIDPLFFGLFLLLILYSGLLSSIFSTLDGPVLLLFELLLF